MSPPDDLAEELVRRVCADTSTVDASETSTNSQRNFRVKNFM